MVTHITAPPPGAMAELTLQVADDCSRPQNPGELTKFSTTPSGPKVRKHTADRAKPMTSGRKVAAGADVAEEA